MRKTSLVGLLTFVLSLLCVSLNAQTTNGLQLWLKPEGLTNTVPASPISFWTDSAGGGYHATNNSGVQQPTYANTVLNGYPTAHFTGDGQISANLNWLLSPLPFNSAFTNFTAIIVYKATIPATVNPRLQLIHQVGGFANLYIPVTATTTNIKSDAGNFATAGTPVTTGIWKIATVVEDATSVKIYENGGLIESKGIGSFTANSGGGWLFGARQDKTRFGFNGDIAEILVYSNSLTGTERAATENYLASKYNLPATLTLLSDDFNTVADPGGINDDLGTRQSGLVASQSYYSGGGPVDIAGGRLSLSNSSPAAGYEYYYAAPNWNLLPYEGGATVQISFDIINLAGDHTASANDSWASFSLSQYTDGGGGPVTDWGMLIRTNGTGATISWPGGGLSFGGISVTPSNQYHVDMTIANGTVHLFINGVDQGTTTILCPLGNAVSRMFFGLGQNNNGAVSVSFDNLVVTRTSTPGAAVPASLQIADSFNSADAADINAGVARQTGPASPSAWITNGNVNTVLSISGNTLLMSNSPGGGQAIGMASSSLDFRPLEHLNSFRISYTVSGTNDATSNDSWVGLRFRDNAPSHFVADADGGGTGMNFFTGDGRWFLWQSVLGPTNTSSVVKLGTVPVAASYDFVIEVLNNVMQVKINGLQLALGCGGAGYNLPAYQLANFVNLHCFAGNPATAAYAKYDNFKFEALDPGFSIPAPTIVNPALASGGFSLGVNSSNSIFYAVDTKADLTLPTWTYLGGFVGNGSLVNYTNSPATGAQQFYRVRVP
jgi:hypothetical protein